MLTLQFLGTGTPVGTAGLLQSCIALRTTSALVLLDCGLTSMVALARARIPADSVDAVVLSHLHGDHFGGVPLLLLERALGSPSHNLCIAGPPSAPERIRQALDVHGWSGAWDRSQSSVEFRTLPHRHPVSVADVTVTAFEVPHNPATEPTGLRIEHDGKMIGYSGDSGWTPNLLEVAADADVFICAVWDFARGDQDPSFLDYRTLLEHRARFSCQRIILTHLGPPMLEHVADARADGFLIATDGQVLEL